MKKFLVAMVLGCCMAMTAAAQTMSTTVKTQTKDKDGSVLPSPRMLTTAKVGGAQIDIDYGAPSVRGRNVFYDLVKMGEWWRTGANEATSFKTSGNVMIGSVMVPAGSYTLYTMPTKGGWWLIVNKQTGQWGTKYDKTQDLGRTKLMVKTAPSLQEVMSISIDHIQGDTGILEIRWAKQILTAEIMAH